VLNIFERNGLEYIKGFAESTADGARWLILSFQKNTIITVPWKKIYTFSRSQKISLCKSDWKSFSKSAHERLGLWGKRSGLKMEQRTNNLDRDSRWPIPLHEIFAIRISNKTQTIDLYNSRKEFIQGR